MSFARRVGGFRANRVLPEVSALGSPVRHTRASDHGGDAIEMDTFSSVPVVPLTLSRTRPHVNGVSQASAKEKKMKKGKATATPMDPFVRITLPNGQFGRTKAVPKGHTDPHWGRSHNNKFTLLWNAQGKMKHKFPQPHSNADELGDADAAAPGANLPPTFEVRVFDEDVGVNDLIGGTYVKLGRFVAHPGEKFDLEIELFQDDAAGTSVAAGLGESGAATALPAGLLHIEVEYESTGDGTAEQGKFEFTIFSGSDLHDTNHEVIRDISSKNDWSGFFIAVPLLIVYIATGTLFYMFMCGLQLIDAVYFCFSTFTTVGYGDQGSFQGPVWGVPAYDVGYATNTDGTPKWYICLFSALYAMAGVGIGGVSLGIIFNRIIETADTLEDHISACIDNSCRPCCEKIFCKGGRTCPRVSLEACLFSVPTTLCITGSFIAIGTVFFAFVELDYTLWESWIQAFYWSVVTCTTVGYGDFHPTTWQGKMGTCVYMVAAVMMFTKLINDSQALLVKNREKKVRCERARCCCPLSSSFECSRCTLRPTASSSPHSPSFASRRARVLDGAHVHGAVRRPAVVHRLCRFEASGARAEELTRNHPNGVLPRHASAPRTGQVGGSRDALRDIYALGQERGRRPRPR